jgi:NAD(P)-dependent dehydrogenase (short-subunit alcohol dehydrogenase family)
MVANAGISMMRSIVDSSFRVLPWSSRPVSCIWLTFDALLLASVEDFDRILAVNVRGTFNCYKHAAKQMISQGRGGRIIGQPPPILSFSSPSPSYVTRARRGSFSHAGACSGTGKQAQASLGAYSASKFGIRGLTQCAGACSSFFDRLGRCSRADATLNRHSFRTRRTRYYCKYLCPRARKDPNVYAL